MNKILKEHAFVVIAREHYNPLGIIRSIGEAGLSPIAIIIKGKKHFVGSCKYLSRVIYVNNVEEAFSALIDNYSGIEKKPFVFITDDYCLEYMDCIYNEIKDDFYITNARQSGKITYFMNKNNINQLASSCGIKVPKSEVVKTGELPKTLEYPIITKAIASTSGAWKADSFVCSTEQELISAYTKIQGEKLLLQEYINRKAEFNIDGVAVNHGQSVFLSMTTKYIYLLEGRYSAYMEVSNVANEELSIKLKEMIRRIEYEGIFDGEFMLGDNDEIYFLEVNLRPNAFNYASTCAGMNDPIIWASGMIEGNISEADCFKRIPYGFRAMVETSDFKDRVLGKRTNIVRWILDFAKCDCHFYYNKMDIKPFFRYIL